MFTILRFKHQLPVSGLRLLPFFNSIITNQSYRGIDKRPQIVNLKSIQYQLISFF